MQWVSHALDSEFAVNDSAVCVSLQVRWQRLRGPCWERQRTEGDTWMGDDVFNDRLR